MFIFCPELKDDEQKALVGELENVLKENQSQIENSQVFGRRALAFAIGKEKEGIYYLITFSSSVPATVSKLKNTCKINDKVLRVLVVNKSPKAR